jgi:hypothetical protein
VSTTRRRKPSQSPWTKAYAARKGRRPTACARDGAGRLRQRSRPTSRAASARPQRRPQPSGASRCHGDRAHPPESRDTARVGPSPGPWSASLVAPTLQRGPRDSHRYGIPSTGQYVARRGPHARQRIGGSGRIGVRRARSPHGDEYRARWSGCRCCSRMLRTQADSRCRVASTHRASLRPHKRGTGRGHA